MAEHAPEEMPLPTIWCVPDALWERNEPILKEDPPKSTGRAAAHRPTRGAGRDRLSAQGHQRNRAQGMTGAAAAEKTG